MEVYTKMTNPFKRQKEVVHVHHHHKADTQVHARGSKFGSISFNENFSFGDSAERREISRKVNRESLTAKGISRRFIDSVVNVGLSWESSPMWDMIPDAPTEPEARRQWTVDIETRWKLYADSKESDIKESSNFGNLQRTIFELGLQEGEAFILLMYLSDPLRISNVTTKIINNDQISTPFDNTLTQKIIDRGGSIHDGVEFDSLGKEVAIWVKPSLSKPHIRIPYFSPKGRRFVIHYKPGDHPGEARGIPEMASLSYELSRLTEVEINEIEKMASASTWMGVVTADKDAYVKKPDFLKESGKTDVEESHYTPGIDTVNVGDKALIMNNLEPGQQFNMFKSDYTNTNLEPMLETYESRSSGSMGMPYSVYKMKFDSSYNASRSAILFFWNNVVVRRDDLVSGFLAPLKRAVITEWEKAGIIKAQGFGSSNLITAAWLWGAWNGINRPSVDPVKDAQGSKMRRSMGDETGEKGAKSYNGSDWADNVERLTVENKKLAEANEPLTRQDNTSVTESKSIQLDASDVESGGQSDDD